MATQSDLYTIAWPLSRLGELIENLARRGGLLSHPQKLSRPPEGVRLAGEGAVGQWIDAAASNLGLEAEAVETDYAGFELLVHGVAPAILRLPASSGGDEPHYLGLVRGGGRRALVLAPNLRPRRISVEAIRKTVFAADEGPLGQEIDHLLEKAGIPPERAPRARRAILLEQLGALRAQCGWILRLSPGARLVPQLRQAGALRPAIAVLAFYFVQVLLSIATWYVIGRGVFQGHFDWGWLLAWAILLFATIPVQLLVSDAQSELSMRAGAVFKQRLITGTLNLEPEEIRHQGMGQFLGRVMESEAVEMLGLSGGLMALLSFIELMWAILILARGAGGAAQAAMLGLWILVILFILWRYYLASRAWGLAYQDMTNDLVERMVGHRTRLAQEDPLSWHEEEDQALDHYLKLSESLDRVGIQLNALASRGWIAVGLIGMAVPFISGQATPQALAISLAGVLLAAQGFAKLVAGAQGLTGLLLAWQQVSDLFRAAERPRDIRPLDIVLTGPSSGRDGQAPELKPSEASQGAPLVVARELTYRYRPAGRPVIQDISLSVYPGDRLLLEGPSGGGKTTLAALLTGLRKPESGSLYLFGYDRQLLGSDEWRRHIVMAPQFQENHVFSDTLAFNLLMGRRWPPQPADIEEAEAVCGELGLGEVISRMPSGFQQILGESGWQLSHGERSRLFIARTLLQQAELIILDESFGALDPENLYRALSTVLRRARTVLVIAHP